MRTLQIGDEWLDERDGELGRYYFELCRHLPATRTTAPGLVVGSLRVSVVSSQRIRSFYEETML